MRSLIQLHDAPWRWQVGLESAVAMGLPLGLFTLAGQQPLGLQAALGSFTALYGASLGRSDRARCWGAGWFRLLITLTLLQ
ncbi:hypothetical protein [Hymenobacter persicinus]|uniref:FUSC family protein n=1 Tax=Hymenobacter persicinus TaxID=2025506 RepID=A0A4Q5LHN0_9BACT|nr:hypothetical protein [Hymenobacter persicinus]RYU81841.1 hypothetical protein EWM57_05525 [Hymenobacter persicinus]